MNVNHRLFLGILSVAGFLIIVGYIVVFNTWLDKPQFFQHSYDQAFYEKEDHQFETRFFLRYMTNVHDDRVITRVEFPEIPQLNATASELDQAGIGYSEWSSSLIDTPGRTYGRYGQYDVREIVIHIDDKVDLNNKVLSQVKVIYDDLSEQMVEIGEIRFWDQSTNSEILHSSMSTSIDGEKEVAFIAQKKFEITQMDSGPLDEYADVLSIELNGSPIDQAEGMKVEEDDLIMMTWEIKRNENILNEYTLFEISPQITAVDQNGKTFQQKLVNLHSHTREYNFWKLHNYIKAREER